jgi:serine/threonine protein kinase
MGGAVSSKKDPVVLDPETHEFGVKPTGTLIYNFNTNGNKADAPEAAAETAFYGLDVPYESISMGDSIGQGTYGKVYKAVYNNQEIAVKKLFLSVVPHERAENMEDFAKEIKILSVLKHPAIVHFMGACRRDPNYCLLFELCGGSVGNLLSTVRKRKVQVTWRMCIRIALDSARAVNYLHTLEPKILHRDLKAENLLLDEKFNCKLTDFGLSRGYETKAVMTVCGTPCWVAPEIFRGEAYTEAVDVYSYGVVLWELFCFEKPYKDQDCVELPYLVAKKHLRPPLLRHCPEKLNDLMSQCWHADMTKRPAFAKIVESLEEMEELYKEHLSSAVDVKSKAFV